MEIHRRKRKQLQTLFASLSEREQQVAIAIASGSSASRTAKRLRIDVKTVSTYRARVLGKLAVKSNAEVAVAAYRAGLLQ